MPRRFQALPVVSCTDMTITKNKKNNQLVMRSTHREIEELVALFTLRFFFFFLGERVYSRDPSGRSVLQRIKNWGGGFDVSPSNLSLDALDMTFFLLCHLQ